MIAKKLKSLPTEKQHIKKPPLIIRSANKDPPKARMKSHSMRGKTVFQRGRERQENRGLENNQDSRQRMDSPGGHA